MKSSDPSQPPDQPPPDTYEVGGLELDQSYAADAQRFLDAGNTTSALRTLEHLIHLHRTEADPVRAILVLDQAIDLAQSAHPSETKRLMTTRGHLLTAAAANDVADRGWIQLHTWCESHGDRDGMTLAMLASFDTAEDPDARIEAALTTSPEGSGWWHAAHAFNCYLNDMYDEASLHADAALTIARQTDDLALEGRSRSALAFPLDQSSGEHGLRQRTETMHVLRMAGEHTRYVKLAHNSMVDCLQTLQFEQAQHIILDLEAYVRSQGLPHLQWSVDDIRLSFEVLTGHYRAAAVMIDSLETNGLPDPRGVTSRALRLAIHRLAYVHLRHQRCSELRDQLDELADDSNGSVIAEAMLEQDVIEALGHDIPDIDVESLSNLHPEWRSTIVHTIARHGALRRLPQLMGVAARLQVAGANEVSPLVALEARETLALLADAGVDREQDLLECSARWESAGHSLNAALAEAASLLARTDRTGTVAGRDIVRLSQLYDHVVELGGVIDASVLADRISLLGADSESSRWATARYGTDFLEELTPTERAHVESLLILTPFNAGQVLLEAGHTVSMVSILQRGRALRASESSGGRRLWHDVIDPGGVFGEEALLDRVPRHNIIAIDDGARWLMRPAQLAQIIDRFPHVGTRLNRSLWDRSEDAAERLREAVFLKLEQRLAATIDSLCDRYGHPTLEGAIKINLPLTQVSLAEMVGATRPAVANVIARWRADHVLDFVGRRIVVTDRDLLRVAAQSHAA